MNLKDSEKTVDGQGKAGKRQWKVKEKTVSYHLLKSPYSSISTALTGSWEALNERSAVVSPDRMCSIE